jgi:transposase InsO family protein
MSWTWPSAPGDPGAGGIVHADHGVQSTSWVFTQKIRSAGLLPSFGTVGDGLDNAVMETLSGRRCRSNC